MSGCSGPCRHIRHARAALEAESKGHAKVPGMKLIHHAATAAHNIVVFVNVLGKLSAFLIVQLWKGSKSIGRNVFIAYTWIL